ncbi:hypothetical protein AHAS_Ahas17G0233500 [Arachis hypogaea]
MNIVAWNIRGAANTATIRTLKEIKRQHRPTITLLYETKCSGDRAKEVIRDMQYNFYHIEEAEGYVGGIWVLWDQPSIRIDILISHQQFVHMKIRDQQNKVWYLTAVYASPQEVVRRTLWESLKTVAGNVAGAWLVVGDFNEIADEGEKKGGASVDRNACRKFKDWIQSCNLLDLGYVGSKFTWRGGQREGLDRVFKRLDRGLSNADWRREFADARVEILPRVNSDHHPLLVNMTPLIQVMGEKPFRFEAMWKTHPTFNDFIRNSWPKDSLFPRALSSLTTALKKWNREVFGNVFKRKRKLLGRIAGIQKTQSYGRNPFLEDLERELNRELEQILEQEEILWMQKSRQLWITDGDRNTKYYHTKTAIRRRKNRILKLRLENGNWSEDQEELKNSAIAYYSKLYEEDNFCSPCLRTSTTYPVLSNQEKRSISKGRVTLAQSTISPILNFDMLHSQVPQGGTVSLELLQTATFVKEPQKP